MNKLLFVLVPVFFATSVSGQTTAFKLQTPRSKAVKAFILSKKVRNDIKLQRRTDPNVKWPEPKSQYLTLEKLDLKHMNLTIKDNKAEITKIYEKLYLLLDTVKNPKRYKEYDSLKKLDTARIRKLDNTINSLEIAAHELKYQVSYDILETRLFNVGFNNRKSKAFFDILYDERKRFNAVANAGLNIGDRSGSVYTELVNGNLGLVRVALGTMISNSNSPNEIEKKNEEAFQRLTTYGGNTVLNIEYPLIYMHSNNKLINFIGRFVSKGTADFPAFGTTTDKWAGSAVSGIDIYLDGATTNNQLRFYTTFNYNKSYVRQVFKENLGIDRTNFSFGQLTVGIVFKETFRLSFIVTTFSSLSKLENRNVIAGGQVLK